MNKENWTGNEKSIYTTLGASDHSDYDRAEEDYYATHPSAITDLFSVGDFDEEIWEPACGQGHLSKMMEKHGKDVYSTDKVDRGFGDDFFDFLKCDVKWNGDIITNPPYKYAKDFVLKSLEMVGEGQRVAMFMKLTFLEGKERAKSLFNKHPPRRIWVYSYRKNVARNGEPEQFEESSAVCYAWFVWVKGYKGKPEIGWITEDRELGFVEDVKMEAFC